MFYDEFGFSFLERLWRTWAPRGQRPILSRVTRDRRVLTTAVGLTVSGKIYKRHFEGGMKSQDVITALEHLRHHMPEGFVLICDHARIHTGEVALRYFFEHPEIIVEPLPKYAPELNPEDGFAVPWQCQEAAGQYHPDRSGANSPAHQSRVCAPSAET